QRPHVPGRAADPLGHVHHPRRGTRSRRAGAVEPPARLGAVSSLFRTGLTCAVLLCAAPALSPGAALAGTLDQQQTDIGTGGFSIGAHQTVAQTFTAGLTGKLDRADLYLGTLGGPPVASLTVAIRSVSGGAPTGSVLASTSVSPPGPASDGYVPLTFP